ncbi:unnamed protein product [Ilex paraguariensis]|uniref:Uncharacterized protein n=1 Tax=Ilex paraguariensis TaxID=185542 RepID=A0ABC8T9N5_9AQUA
MFLSRAKEESTDTLAVSALATCFVYLLLGKLGGTDPCLYVIHHETIIRAIELTHLPRDFLSWSTESLSSSTQSCIAATSLGFIPWLCDSLTIIVDVDRAVLRETERAVWARSFGSVRMALEWLESELKQSLGYVVALQDVLMNSVLVVPAGMRAAEFEFIWEVKASRRRKAVRKLLENEPSMSLPFFLSHKQPKASGMMKMGGKGSKFIEKS